MMKHLRLYPLLLMLVFYTSCKGQKKTNLPKDGMKSGPENVSISNGPNSITRNLIQDRKGNLWMASWQGVFKYDGRSFINITANVSSARFFSILEDSKGNFWFGSIGSGVYYYNGKSFKNITIKDGLLNNDVGSIYEDKSGNIWFGVFGGTSRYDGKSFRNYIIDGDTMNEDLTGKTFPNRPDYEVSSIIEDKTGKYWFATRGNTFVYDGRSFTTIANNGKPFKNVRTIIQDKKGNIWLAGNDGLWRYDGHTFTNFTHNFVGYVYEDKTGNIWTSSQSNNSQAWTNLEGGNSQAWALSRYDGKTLYDKNPRVTEIAYKPMFFGILEDDKKNIWFGSVNGVYSYDGNTVTHF